MGKRRSYAVDVAVLSSGFFFTFCAFNTAQVGPLVPPAMRFRREIRATTFPCRATSTCAAGPLHSRFPRVARATKPGNLATDVKLSFLRSPTLPPHRTRPQNLESTVVSDNQLVNLSLALLYGVFTLVAVFAPRIVSVIGPRL